MDAVVKNAQCMRMLPKCSQHGYSIVLSLSPLFEGAVCGVFKSKQTLSSALEH